MKRNHRNMGYWKKLDMDVGYLYPTYVEHLIPGDIVRLGQSEVIRAVNPPTAPITDSFKYHTVYVAVPKRILDRHFVRNMTGTKTGDVHGNFKVFNPTDYITKTTINGVGSLTTDFDLSVNDELGERTLSEDDFSNGSLMDYFSCDMLQNIGKNSNKINVNNISAYYLAWNFLFRNAEVEDAVAPIWDIEDNESVDSGLQFLDVYEHLIDEEGCDVILPRNSPLCRKGLMRVHWRKDYFSDVTLNSQRGTMPTVPINFSNPSMLLPTYSVIGNDDYVFANMVNSEKLTTSDTSVGGVRDKVLNARTVGYYQDTATTALAKGFHYRNSKDVPQDTLNIIGDYFGAETVAPNTFQYVGTSALNPFGTIGDSEKYGGLYSSLNLSDVNATFSVTDLRSALVISHFMEMNNYGGFKWSEFLMNHFGTCPTDESLERPLFLGSFSDDIFTSEVLQQSSSQSADDTSLGHLGGKMIGVGGKKKITQFRAKEHMVILGLSWISCERNYESGLNRMWLETDYLDTYFNVFTGLGCQAIDVQELNAVNTSDNAYNFKSKPKNFAFTERYSHLMSRRNEICGRLRSGTVQYFDSTDSTFKNIAEVKSNYEYYYHNYTIGEGYTIAGDDELVNGATSAVSPEFLAMKPQLTDVFTSSTDVPFVVNIYNRADMFRPIPLHCKVGVDYV